MLEQMNDRGPDSAGVAVYRDPAPSGSSKLTLFSADPLQDWDALAAELGQAFGGSPEPEVRASHAVMSVEADAPEAEAWIRSVHPELRVMSAGRTIEIYKEIGRPEEFVRQFALEDFEGSHALGHTRMATESRVTTEGSHPFSTGHDLCLVHNGSLSNHNRLRENLRREGIDVPDGERHRGRRGLPRLAAPRGRLARSRRSKAASTTWTASTRSSSAPRTASPSCATRSRASPPSSPRPTTGWRWPPSGGRSRPCPARPRHARGSRCPGVVYAWERAKV